MKTGKSNFSLLEILIVLVILVMVMTVAMVGFGGKSPGETIIETSEIIEKVFKNASIRSQSFQVQVNVRMKVEPEEKIKCYLEMVRSNPELPTIRPEDETEEETARRTDKEYNVRLWSGEDSYELPSGVKLTEYEELLNDNNEIFFYFYPDGEATGPNLKVLVGEREFHLTVDRLNGQLVLFEKEIL